METNHLPSKIRKNFVSIVVNPDMERRHPLVPGNRSVSHMVKHVLLVAAFTTTKQCVITRMKNKHSKVLEQSSRQLLTRTRTNFVPSHIHNLTASFWITTSTTTWRSDGPNNHHKLNHSLSSLHASASRTMHGTNRSHGSISHVNLASSTLEEDVSGWNKHRSQRTLYGKTLNFRRQR